MGSGVFISAWDRLSQTWSYEQEITDYWLSNGTLHLKAAFIPTRSIKATHITIRIPKWNVFKVTKLNAEASLVCGDTLTVTDHLNLVLER